MLLAVVGLLAVLLFCYLPARCQYGYLFIYANVAGRAADAAFALFRMRTARKRAQQQKGGTDNNNNYNNNMCNSNCSYSGSNKNTTSGTHATKAHI